MNTHLPNFDLTNKIAIITGASKGIGLAIAYTYAAAGATVIISSRKQENLESAAQAIQEKGYKVHPIAAHTGDKLSIQKLITDVVNNYGGIDILVNNAATNPHFGPILTSEESHWDKILDINIKGYFRVIQACMESMRARGGGKIINVSSINGLQAQPGTGIYCISKAGVIMLTQVLAIELAADNIQVNTLAPGLIKTKFSRILWDTPQIYKAALKSIPQGRIGMPDDLSGISLYLASSASDFTTGAIFVIDGGQLAGGTNL